MINRLSIVPRKVVITGFLVVVSVALVTYAPAVRKAFFLEDDYTYLHWAGSMPLSEYLVHVLDPRLQNLYYRPLWRMLILVEYGLFHSEASYYHLVQIMIHLANSLLVLGIVWRLSKRWPVALFGAVLYAGFPVASEAVFWIADQTPLATFFSLAAALFWADYLQSKDRRSYLLAIAALVLAFLSRESSVVLPPTTPLKKAFLTAENTESAG